MVTLRVAIDQFIADVAGWKHNETEKAYWQKLRKLEAFCGGESDVVIITPAELERFRRSLLTQPIKRSGAHLIEQPLSVFYVRGILATVVNFSKWCARAGVK